MDKMKLSQFFSNKRAETLPDDLWGSYVLPLNYAQFNLFNYNRAIHVVGGRGSGKTMFLKFHCFPTMLSKKRSIIKKGDLRKIGIYWKPDTDFLKHINDDYLGKNWEGIFKTYVGLSIISELSKFVDTLIKSNYEFEDDKLRLEELTLNKEIVEFLNLNEEVKFTEIWKRCQFLRSKLNDWLNYPVGPPPVIFAPKEKLLYLIENVLHEIECLNETSFYIFLDEFENLQEEQQKIINSWMKHSSSPLIFCVAYKKYYEVNVQTTGREVITRIHDYEVIDLEEDVYGEKNFSILAAEILLNNIQNYYIQEENLEFKKIIEFNLSSTDHLKYRNEVLYKRQILHKIKKIFPSYSTFELANDIFNDKGLKKKLKDLINSGIKDSNFKVDDFINKNLPRETIVNATLLNRKTKGFEIEALKKQFDENDLKYKEWINSTFVGTILYLYTTYSEKVCPYYGGFNRFVLMSKNNVRHLLELCHKSLLEYETEIFEMPNIEDLFVPVSIQAKAARSISKQEFEHKLADISSYGKKLQLLVERLGNIYLLSQKRKSQSEPEKNHFVVVGYNIENHPDPTIKKLLFELRIWSVLVSKKNTKLKDTLDNAFNEYHLHPIYAPYFGISPRQKRKFEFTLNEFETIFKGDAQAFKKIYESYFKKWFQEEAKTTIVGEQIEMDFK